MSLLNFIPKLFSPVTSLIDEIFTNDEERAAAKEKLLKIQNELNIKLLDYENQLLKQKSEIIKAEANGQSWIQRNWRPITMLTFLVLVVCDSFGLLTFRLSSEAWTLLQFGLSGYVVGRSAEKIIPKLLNKEKLQ